MCTAWLLCELEKIPIHMSWLWLLTTFACLQFPLMREGQVKEWKNIYSYHYTDIQYSNVLMFSATSNCFNTGFTNYKVMSCILKKYIRQQTLGWEHGSDLTARNRKCWPEHVWHLCVACNTCWQSQSKLLSAQMGLSQITLHTLKNTWKEFHIQNMVMAKLNVENLGLEGTWQMILNRHLAASTYLISSIRSLNNGMLLRFSSTDISL